MCQPIVSENYANLEDILSLKGCSILPEMKYTDDRNTRYLNIFNVLNSQKLESQSK